MQVPRNSIRESNPANWRVQRAGNAPEFCRSTRSLTDGVPAPRGAYPGWRSNLKAHMGRVGAMSTLVAEAAGLNFRDAELVGDAARVHDLGKVFIPHAILEKRGPLNEGETRTMRTHTVLGHSVLRRTEDPALGLAANVALQHHENWDGSGYPYGLSGEDIGLAARIVSVCDVYDSLRDERPYKPAFSHRRAMSIITEGDGRTRPTMFDPSVLDAFVRNQHLCSEIFVNSMRFRSPPPLPQFLHARAA